MGPHGDFKGKICRLPSDYAKRNMRRADRESGRTRKGQLRATRAHFSCSKRDSTARRYGFIAQPQLTSKRRATDIVSYGDRADLMIYAPGCAAALRLGAAFILFHSPAICSPPWLCPNERANVS